VSDDPKWLTVADVAKLLDLAPKTVYIMASPGCTEARRIPSHRLGPRGGKLRFLKSDVDAYIKTTRTAPASASYGPLKHLQPRIVGPGRRRP
jgi:excisionase family DNA binding protein